MIGNKHTESALTGELKICRIDKHVSSCCGNEEVFILVEKVGKKNIKIKFFELDDEDNEVWCDYGKFSELDVHHQYAIVFRTPPYRDTEIDKTVDVFLQLYRPTDGDCSEPIKFSYKPSEKGARTRKRPRTSVSDDIPVAIVHGYNNPVLGQAALNQSTAGGAFVDDLNVYDPTPELFEAVMKEDNPNGMNSSEFQDFLKNFSISSFASGYSDTFDSTFGKDGCTMDITTDGVKRLKPTKKVGLQKKDPLSETSVTSKLSRVSIDEVMEKESRTESLRKETLVMISNHYKIRRNLMPLHCAILNEMHDQLKQMLLVLGKGPNRVTINERNKKNETVLHLAVVQNQPEIVKILLAFGCDPNIANNEGNTALHLAIMNNSHECINELLSTSNNFRHSIPLDYNLSNYDGWTPLHTATREKDLLTVKKLIAAGVDVNRRDTKYGRTALHIAVEEARLNIAQYLLENTKIDVNATNFDGNTALHLAVVQGGSISRIMVELLLRHKADPKKANHVTGNSPRGTTLPIEVVDIKDEVEIKDEPESEEEEYELKIADESEEEDEEESSAPTSGQGQTPLDLATNKKDCLCCVVLIVNNGLFEMETFEKLCSILDKSRGWVNLAELLDYNFLVASIRDTASPSKMLFNYADLHGNVSVQDIRGFLEALDEHQAVKVLDEMLKRQT
ncbi:hypothetical protein C0J52_13050 [Blattella germanica]|nr:hypothetical protein C0J52_13050 [Blattella germanica]